MKHVERTGRGVIPYGWNIVKGSICSCQSNRKDGGEEGDYYEKDEQHDDLNVCELVNCGSL